MSKRFCFTLNNPTGLLDLDNLPDCVTFVIYQEEVGLSGTHHLQGYIETAKPMRYTTLVNLLDWDPGHWSVAKGTATENIAYCSKEDSRVGGPFRVGDPAPDNKQGARNDLAMVQEAIHAGATDFELFRDHPCVMARCRKFVSEYRSLWRQSQLPATDFVPRVGWQSDLQAELAMPVTPRIIIWIYDLIGNVGKSYFALNSDPEAYYVSGGKHSDIYYAYDCQKKVFFDWPRSSEDTFPYAVLEKIKDGCIFKAKYESSVVRFPSPHIVVFANFRPDESKLSLDRWDIRDVGVRI